MNNKTQNKKSFDLKEYQKEYRERNKNKLKEYHRNYKKTYAYSEKTKKKRYEYTKKYRKSEEYKLRRSKIEKNKRKIDQSFKIKENLRGRIYKAIKNNKSTKSDKTLNLLGCSIEEVKIHLEKQFKEGMTWDNHGIKGWHIDHIKPCASFDLTDPEQQKQCFHYTNLQPLWWYDNLSKRDKLSR